jgi:GH24 family phage-related lysozyme (muramidase)
MVMVHEYAAEPARKATQAGAAPRVAALGTNAAALLHLQRLAGNTAVTALLSGTPTLKLAHVIHQPRLPSITVQRDDVPNDPYPTTNDGDQPGLFSLSDEGAEFLTRHEGVRLNLYNDSEGHCTIGVGHLVHRGNCNGTEPAEFKRGLSKEAVLKLFKEDVGVYEAAVSGSVSSRLNQYWFDALVSFTFNVGIGAFKGSGVLKELNAKHYSKVPAEMLKWSRPTAIRGRRADEAKLFRTGQY